MPSVSSHELPSPWRTFLADVDRQLAEPIALHCLGGFVAALYYDLPRPTNDLDYVEVVPHDLMPALQEIAGIGHRLPRSTAFTSNTSEWPASPSPTRRA